MGPLQLLRRSVIGVARRLRRAIEALIGPPWRALLRVLFGARDRVDAGLESGGSWWQRLWGAAPDDGAETTLFPHRRSQGLVAAVVTGLVHVVLAAFDPVGLASVTRAGLLLIVYLVVRLVLRASQPRDPQHAWGWFLAESGRRAGLLWWERGGALLAVAALIVIAIVGDVAGATVSVVVLFGFLPLLGAELDVRPSDRRAPQLPVMPDEADDPTPDSEGVVERVFRFQMPHEVAVGSHEVTVRIDEQRYLDAQRANPVTHWIDGVPQMQRWVHYQTPEVPRTARDLRSLAARSGYSTFAELQLVLAFAQSVDYRSDQETKGLPDHWQYAIETLYEQTGDCEDTTILSAAVLLAMGHQVVVLHMPKHAALGVPAPVPLGGHVFRHGGVDYLYAETTAEGALIGALPDDVDPDEVEVLAL